MPASNVLRDLSPVERFMLFIQSTIVRVDELALSWLLSLHLDLQSYILELYPCLASVMVEFVSEGLNLFNIASVREYPSESPA